MAKKPISAAALIGCILLELSIGWKTFADVPNSTPGPTPELPVKANLPVRTAKPEIVTTLTRVVGEVGDEVVVTSREVRINQAVEQALSTKPGTPGSLEILTGEESSFPGEVGRVLDEWAIYLEAKSLSSQPASAQDVAKAIKEVENYWAKKPEWLKLEVSPEELKGMIERKLEAKEFARLKSDPELAPVSDEDALAYYKKNRLRFGSLPFETFRDNIKSFLIKQHTEKRLAEWHDVLRRKYKVRNYIAG